jgi:hypothetical protein
MPDDQPGDSEWIAFIARVEAAEDEFAQGRPAAFKALWSHDKNVTLCSGFGGVACGWDNVAARLACAKILPDPVVPDAGNDRQTL